MRTPLNAPWIYLCCVAVLLAGAESWAGLAPESVLLVVNADRAASLTVANEYARLRSIPPINIVPLTGVTNVEQLSVDEFRKQILGPVLTAIDERGLRSIIHCVTYSADLPTAIHVNGDVGERKMPQIFTPVASINGLTFLHRLTMAKDIRYLDLNANCYARRVISTSNDTPWQPDELKRYAEALQRLKDEPSRQRSGKPGERPADALHPVNDPSRRVAIDVLVDLKQAHPQSTELLYNLACSLAVGERADEALVILKEAVGAGWFDHRHSARDPDLKSLQERPEFKSLLDQMRSAKLDVQQARGFRGDLGWSPNGDSAPRDDLPHYLLSTVLGVTAGRGITVAEIVSSLHRSAGADRSRPRGTVYFVRNGDIRSTTREWGFASAVDKLKSLGVDAAIEEGVLPHRKEQVAGAMIGIADFDWTRSESTILPGAIVEHLTSFGGVMTAGAGQTPLTEFLRHGAAGASGTVTEPYAIQAKFPNPFIHVHYACGCSLAEAFFQSVTGPYQLLIVGDPLCNPWQHDFSVTVQTPPTDKAWQGKVTIQPRAESSGGLTAAEFMLFVDGMRMLVAAPGQSLEVDTAKLDDGEHQITVLARANDAVETIGRWAAAITIRNGSTERQLKLSCAVESDHPFDKTIPIEAECPGATEIQILHFGRNVAKIKGDSGSVMLNPKDVGSGPVALQPIATFSDGTRYRGKTLSVVIPYPAVAEK